MTKVLVQDSDIYEKIRAYIENAEKVENLGLELGKIVIPTISLSGNTPEGEIVLIVIADNNATYVDVLDITGAGILQSCGYYTTNHTPSLTMNFIIDGVVEETPVFPALGAVITFPSIQIQRPFATSCKLQMKLSEAGAFTYWGCALVE